MSDVRAVLSPLLLTSYMSGVRIIEFPASESRLWCSFLYMLLLWSIYYLTLWCTIADYAFEKFKIFQIQFWLQNSIALLSVILGVYYDKKYRICLRKLAIVDNTLEKLGVMTDYQELYTKMLLTIFGWFAYIICITCIGSLWHTDNYSAMYSSYICFMCGYSSYVNLLDDMIIITTLGYIELKFEQLNEYLRKLIRHNEHGMKRTWKHAVLLPCQNEYPKFTSSEYVIWVVMYSQNPHSHLELCKISRVLNLTFGLQMTYKMGAYFALEMIRFSELLNIFLIDNYHQKKTLFLICNVIFLILNIFQLFILNYMCEKVNIKAKATGDVLGRIPYSTLDIVTRENISQFLLQLSLRPLKFYGLGLFQFGLKFFYKFSSSLSTVIVILVQSHMST